MKDLSKTEKRVIDMRDFTEDELYKDLEILLCKEVDNWLDEYGQPNSFSDAIEHALYSFLSDAYVKFIIKVVNDLETHLTQNEKFIKMNLELSYINRELQRLADTAWYYLEIEKVADCEDPKFQELYSNFYSMVYNATQSEDLID